MTASELTEFAARVEAGSEPRLTDRDLYYLGSILRQLEQVKSHVVGPSIGSEVLYDNINWLDCFIDQHTRALAAQQQDRASQEPE